MFEPLPVKAPVALAALSVMLLANTQSAHAQYGPPSGSWGAPTLTGSGSITYDYTSQGNIYNGGNPWGDVQRGPGEMIQASSDAGSPASSSTSGTVTETRKWSGSAPPPTKPVYILETSHAISQWGSDGTASGSGTAQDAFNDPPVTSPYNSVGSSGGKLIQMDASSGVISLSGTISATAQTPALSSNNAEIAFANGDFSWDFDSRAVTISCPEVDTSQYRDPPLTGPVIVNTRQSDGTMRGDTVRPYEQTIGGARDETLAYTATVLGNWGTNSSYLWNNQYGGSVEPGDNTDSGVFGTVPDHSVDYSATIWDYHGDPTVTDHIYLHLTDSAGGANATANYYMHFHDQYEPNSWPEDASYPRKQTTQIDPDVPGWPTYSWYAEVNPDTQIIDSQVGPASAASTFSYGGTEMESWHLDGGLGIPVEPVDLHFGGGYDHDIVNHFSSSSIAVPVALQAGQKTWAVYRQDIKRHRGHLDVYGTHGYLSTGVWYRDENVGIEHAVYYPYANASTDNAHDPDPNWLPGY